MTKRHQLVWEAAALAAGLPVAVFASMVITVLGVHDSRLGLMAGAFVGAIVIRMVAFAGVKVRQRSGGTRAGVLWTGVLVMGGVMWLWARICARGGG